MTNSSPIAGWIVNSYWALAALLILGLLSGCGNRFEEQLRDTHQQVKTNVDHLKTQLDNTLASLSGSVLPAVDVPAYNQTTAQKTNALVGNPTYGNWKQDSSGRSFWEWYGMYSLFSNVLGGRNYYDSWSSRPNSSYYGQYGRNRWGSSSDVSRNYDLSQRHPTKYNKPSAATKARYSSTASRSSSFGGSSKSTSKASGSSKTANRTSSYGSSSRSSSYSSSRSSRSGK